MSEDDIAQKGRINKAELEKSRFKQQNLPAWRPNPTMVTTIFTFIIFGVIFIALGVVLIMVSNDIQEFSFEYQEKCLPKNKCTIEIELGQDFKAPSYVYYQIDNFYQNHRRYVKSRDDDQLKGKIKTVDQLSNCDPIRTIKDLGFGEVKNLNNQKLDDDAPANPCGLIARSYKLAADFFSINKPGQSEIEISTKGIAWSTDVEDLFIKPKNANDIQWLDVTDERFIVWMRVAGMPNFKKPWGIIHEDLPKGKYQLTITSNLDVAPFEGKKKFILSTTNSYGGKNTFLAV